MPRGSGGVGGVWSLLIGSPRVRKLGLGFYIMFFELAAAAPTNDHKQGR
jgi:hypothetical protein